MFKSKDVKLLITFGMIFKLWDDLDVLFLLLICPVKPDLLTITLAILGLSNGGRRTLAY